MYRNLFTFLIAVFALTAPNAWPQSFWARTYGTTSGEAAESIQTTTDGGYVIAGVAAPAGSNDFWVLKLDALGNIEWQKAYGGNAVDNALSIRLTSDGGFIVAGETSSFGAGSSDVWILKLDSSGNIQWQKTYGGSSIDIARSIQMTAEGGFIVAGYTDSFGAGAYDYWILKLDSSGDIQWQKTYGGTDNETANSIQTTSDGGFIVAGVAHSFGAGDSDYWILKLDSSGNVEWQKTYGGIEYDEAMAIQNTADGGFIVAGTTGSFSASLGGSSGDYWILKLDSSGNIEWQKVYGGSQTDFAFAINVSSDGGYVFAGSIFRLSDDFLILKLNSGGNIVWQKFYGGDSEEFPGSVLQTSDGRIVVAGFTSSYGTGPRAAWILRLSLDGDIDSSCLGDADIFVASTDAVPDEGEYSISQPSVTVSDSTAAGAVTTVSMDEQCASPNSLPVAVNDSYMTPSGTPLNVAAPGVLNNDVDADGDPLTAAHITVPANGSLMLNADGSFRYLPDSGFVGSDTFTYVVNDGQANSNIATVTITVSDDCLFCDDFEDGVLDPNWTYEKPGWVEDGGFLVGTPVKSKAIAVASPAFAGCTDCEVEVSIKTAGGAFNKVWIYMHRADKRTLTELLIKEENDKVILKQRINKVIVSKNKATATINPNTEYVFRIAFDGAQYTVFMDGTLLFTMAAGVPVPGATVGVAAKSTTVSIGHISVD